MKKLIAFVLLGLTTFTYANINAVVSILPQQTFLKKIGGDKVNISLMVKPGHSPHTYEPKPSQMRDISNSDIYFSIGVEFEDTWLDKFKNLNKNMLVKDMGVGIQKIGIVKHSHHDEHKDEHDEHKDEHAEDNQDPHIWVSPANVKIIATNIYKELSKIDSKNSSYYKANLENFLEEITQTDIKIKQLLKNTPAHSKFMVFHPSWGYFARDYDLTQFAIESGGKSPKPKQIAYLIDEAKEEKVKAIFTAPEFSTKTANQIAKEVGVPVVQISALSAKWSENLIGLAEAISN
ncbi:MAG: zinc transport system substrate-binding protein [Arcobacteraceae bacterium]|jgi:zinc transport system substrate-binding protein